MRKSFCLTLLISLVCMVLAGCGGAKSVKKGDVNLEYTTDLKKSVELPANYPKNQFPVYQDAVVTAVQQNGKDMIVVAFCKDKPADVISFYKDLLKNAQTISTTDVDNDFLSMGVKDGYTYTVSVSENDEEEMKGYPTALGITLIPDEAGMGESLNNLNIMIQN